MAKLISPGAGLCIRVVDDSRGGGRRTRCGRSRCCCCSGRWVSCGARRRRRPRCPSRSRCRWAGALFSTTAVILLGLVGLAAPAATAGSICLDKARGNLTLLLATDLSDSEIVLGKLAARLVPVLGLILCATPSAVDRHAVRRR